MIGWVRDRIDSFRGRGVHAVTVPPMDGALRPNTRLEAAAVVARLPAPDNLVEHRGQVLFSSGPVVHVLDAGTGAVSAWRRFGADVSALCSEGGTLALGLEDGGLILSDGADRAVKGIEGGITSIASGGAGRLIVCVGSARLAPSEWKRDLLQAGATGSVWTVSLGDGVARKVAGGLGWPNGAALAGERIVVAESWTHRLSQIGAAALVSDLPGYPCRLAAAPGGWWLSVFAPRNQLIELVLREKAYRQRMMREVDPAYWIAPSLSPATGFYDPMQGGAIRTHGIVKPWAPTRSYGLLVRLDAGFQPIASYHSRADGRFHGVTSALQRDGRVLVTSKGGNAILALEEVQP